MSVTCTLCCQSDSSARQTDPFSCSAGFANENLNILEVLELGTHTYSPYEEHRLAGDQE